MSNKIYVENKISNSNSRKKKKQKKRKEEQKQYNFKNISKIPEKFSLVTLVTNYHKLSLLQLVVRP